MGVLEIMTQTAELSWTHDSGNGQRQFQQEFIIPPMIIEKANASCTYGAMAGASPALTPSSLTDLASSVEVMVIED